MPISGANLKWYLSGGSGNTDPDAALGGARSTTVCPTGINALFDLTTGDEAAAGKTSYRCVFFRNEDSDSDGLISPVLFMADNTDASDTTYEIGLDPAGKNASATTIANEAAAPAGVSFSAPATKGAGLALPSGPYAQNDYIAVWIKQIVNAGAASTASDSATLRVSGDTI